jgi:hypothetical protein
MNTVVRKEGGFPGRIQTGEAFRYLKSSFDCGSEMCSNHAWRPG